MKHYLLAILFVNMFVSITLAQNTEEYFSTEEKEYYKKKNNFKSFGKIDSAIILNFKFPYLKLQKTEHYFLAYDRLKFDTPASDSNYKALQAGKKTDGFFNQQEWVAGVKRFQILKYGEKDNIRALIYQAGTYENDGNGIWVAYSENDGKDWLHYYTGITQKQPLFLKWYSQRPLIKDNGKLEIDACLLKQLTPFARPSGSPTFECIKDGLTALIEIKDLSRDSDNDGLTDIVEDRFYTDKSDADTDKDGIADNIDTNPLVKKAGSFNDRIILYNAIYNNNIDWESNKGVGKVRYQKAADPNEKAVKSVSLIITEDEELMQIQPFKSRVIFLTPDQYNLKANVFNAGLSRTFISPLFSVDGMPDAYKISFNYRFAGHTYLVYKAEGNWYVKMISSWIV